MPKLLLRVVALVLVPCLVADPATSAGLTPSQISSSHSASHLSSRDSVLFQEQALTSMATWVLSYLGNRRDDARLKRSGSPAAAPRGVSRKIALSAALLLFVIVPARPIYNDFDDHPDVVQVKRVMDLIYDNAFGPVPRFSEIEQVPDALKAVWTLEDPLVDTLLYDRLRHFKGSFYIKENIQGWLLMLLGGRAHPEWVEGLIDELDAKRADDREIAAQLLGQWARTEPQTLLNHLQAKGKVAPVRQVLPAARGVRKHVRVVVPGFFFQPDEHDDLVLRTVKSKLPPDSAVSVVSSRGIPTVRDIENALEANPNTTFIYNYSFGDMIPDPRFINGDWKPADIERLGRRGVLFVIAAGNNNMLSLWSASAYDNVIYVADTDSEGRHKAPKSNFGLPGYLLGAVSPVTIPGRPTPLAGTSYAAPGVAGNIARLLEENSELPERDAIELYASQARPMPEEKLYQLGLLGRGLLPQTPRAAPRRSDQAPQNRRGGRESLSDRAGTGGRPRGYWTVQDGQSRRNNGDTRLGRWIAPNTERRGFHGLSGMPEEIRHNHDAQELRRRIASVAVPTRSKADAARQEAPRALYWRESSHLDHANRFTMPPEMGEALLSLEQMTVRRWNVSRQIYELAPVHSLIHHPLGPEDQIITLDNRRRVSLGMRHIQEGYEPQQEIILLGQGDIVEVWPAWRLNERLSGLLRVYRSAPTLTAPFQPTYRQAMVGTYPGTLTPTLNIRLPLSVASRIDHEVVIYQASQDVLRVFPLALWENVVRQSAPQGSVLVREAYRRLVAGRAWRYTIPEEDSINLPLDIKRVLQLRPGRLFATVGQGSFFEIRLDVPAVLPVEPAWDKQLRGYKPFSVQRFLGLRHLSLRLILGNRSNVRHLLLRLLPGTGVQVIFRPDLWLQKLSRRDLQRGLKALETLYWEDTGSRRFGIHQWVADRGHVDWTGDEVVLYRIGTHSLVVTPKGLAHKRLRTNWMGKVISMGVFMASMLHLAGTQSPAEARGMRAKLSLAA